MRSGVVETQMMDVGDKNLHVVRLLGEGGFGRVFLCRNNEGKFLCVKRIIVQNPKFDMRMIQEEIYIISQLNHPRIVRFLRYYTHGSTVNLVMEYVPNGTMKDILDKYYRCRRMAEHVLLGYFCDILIGLEYLHIRRVMHRDLKPENLLVDAKNRLKISDFGISKVHNPSKERRDMSGTLHYMAPEVLSGDRNDFKSDIWSLGCIVYEMCIGRGPFARARRSADVKQLARQLTCSNIQSIYGPIWASLIGYMLRYDMNSRISLQEIIAFNPAITKRIYRQYFDYFY